MRWVMRGGVGDLDMIGAEIGVVAGRIGAGVIRGIGAIRNGYIGYD